MGREIDRESFTEAEFERFSARLRAGVAALDALLGRPGFGEGPTTVGAELELCLIDAAGRPLPRNRAVLDAAAHPRLTLEADRFNIECNTAPVPLRGRPFAALRRDLDDVLGALEVAAAAQGAGPVAIGILPTLRPDDLTPAAITESPRYRALSHGLRRLRQEAFTIAIDGPEPLTTTYDDVTAEGANTSWQVHLRVSPAAFARTYNAAQIATAPVLAVAGNSPTFLGHRLWDETRVALYRQSVDDRVDAEPEDWRPARVTFGHGWVRRGAAELFAESVALHAPLLAAVDAEDPDAVRAAGGVPQLWELRLHHGTVWRWNRAVYDAAGGGHLRIEFRALPAGPTVIDMLANTAFLLGLTLALAPDADRLVTRLTFGQARRNFYAAARHGVDAELLWPHDEAPSPRRCSVATLVPELLPLARTALCDAGVAPDEVDPLLAAIAARTARRRTGARWQTAALAAFEGTADRPTALRRMLARYRALAATGAPVHDWPLPV
ncbi:MAG: glutamate--cysteine ligase [bacterium]|nr:glutamate--cysteine ligase [bacterium]